MIKDNRNKIVVGIVLLIIALYFGISYFIASQVTNPIAKHIDLSPVFISNNYKDVSFRTSDGLTLKGWLFNPKASKFIIFVPGILDNRTNQGYYGTTLTHELLQNGFGVLLHDPRTRGESDGTIRLKDEKLDVVAAADFLKSRNVEPDKIFILAYSTGARAALLALPQVKDVAGIIVDSTPTNFKSVITHVVTVEQGLPGFILPGVYFWLSQSGLDLGQEKILESVSETKTPILVIHAKNDLSVPLANSEEIISSNKNNKLVVFPKGSHIESYKFNPEMYRSTLFDFLNK